MTTRAGILIAGGGVVGTALAWALAERGASDVTVVDLDLAGVYASSELNAGGARATWWQPVNIESCRATLDFFRLHVDEFAFQERGYLWLYDDPALFDQARRHRELQNRAGLGVEILDVGEIRERFPIVDRRTESLVGGTFSPRDGLVNPNTVRAWYRREAEALGVVFRDRDYIAGVRTERVAGASGIQRRVAAIDVLEIERGEALDASGTIREILCTHRAPSDRVAREITLECDAIVNCLGAWCTRFVTNFSIWSTSASNCSSFQVLASRLSIVCR